jgi:ferredoxin
MIRIRFEHGGRVIEAEAAEGDRLLDAAQSAGLPLEGTCDGDLACATCHVIIASTDFPQLARATEEEEDLLDLAPAATRTSRLSCQIRLTPELDGLTARVP